MEVDRILSDVYVDKHCKYVIDALVFGFFNGAWREGVKQTLYVSDLHPSISGPPTAPSHMPGMQIPQEQHLYDLFEFEGSLKFVKKRSTHNDRMVEVKPLPSTCTAWTNSVGVEIRVGCAVLFEDVHNLKGVCLVTSINSGWGAASIEGVLYQFAMLTMPADEYFEEHSNRKHPHAVLQTNKTISLSDNEVVSTAALCVPAFWHRFDVAVANNFEIIGHLINTDESGMQLVGRITSSPLLRWQWATTFWGNCSVERTAHLITTGVQHSMSIFLSKRSKIEGDADVLYFENVPASFVYLVLGKD